MAACVARNFFSTACRAFVTKTNASRLHVQKRAFSYSRCLTADSFYTDKHEWVLVDGTKGTVGISEYAQDNLGDVVYVELPEVGSSLDAGDVAGCVESVKAASDIYSPVSGTVAEVNTKLEEEPGLINKSPLDDGWIFKLDLPSGTDTSSLMDEAAYKKFIADQ